MITDNKYRALINFGAIPGQIDDMESQVLVSALGLTAPKVVNEMWYDLFLQHPNVNGGSWNDAAFAWLAEGGHTQGTLNERWNAYWAANVGAAAQSMQARQQPPAEDTHGPWLVSVVVPAIITFGKNVWGALFRVRIPIFKNRTLM